MNITFFIGNGFDLNLGYKTSYRDFYDFYTRKYPDDLLGQNIQEDYESWADLESGLGSFYKNKYKGSEEEFIRCKNKMDNSLSEYLSNETKKNIIFEKGAEQEFQKRIVHIDEYLSAEDAENYRKETGSPAEAIHYCFINFNYTYSLDQIVEYTRNNHNPFSTHKGGGTIYTDDIRDPVHIHGTILGELVLGVNDITQMTYKESVSDELSLSMIKSEINNGLGNRKNENVQAVIDKSKYIIIFGMSLGLTDLKWWESIYEWIKINPSHRLIIFQYLKEGTVVSGGETAQLKNQKKKEYFTKVKASSEEFDKYKSQVIVQLDSSVFTFNRISLEKESNS